MPPSKNDELKQLVAEVRYLREELANVKADMVIIKNIVEKSEHQAFFVKYRKWEPETTD
jgi:hypothetical protein